MYVTLYYITRVKRYRMKDACRYQESSALPHAAAIATQGEALPLILWPWIGNASIITRYLRLCA